MSESAHPAQLEEVPCFLCGAEEYDVVYEAHYDRAKDVDLVQKFRASGDELLIDRLVRCRRCGFKYVSPRLRGDLILGSYAEGDDPNYFYNFSVDGYAFGINVLLYAMAH